MSYVDSYFDRDSDIIRVVERVDGKRHYTGISREVYVLL